MMQQEIEQRQKLARKLQDEKMARAAAQKEERLQKQREAQQREMLRAKAVLDRRAQVLAEKEKEKKEAVLAKAHAVASPLSAQHRERPVYAFGSSTPRELGYLTQLTKEQKVYDRKLTPSDRSPTATSGSSGRLTSTPPYGSRNHTPGASMTRSLYVIRSEIKTRPKSIPNYMTQSVMISSKTAKNGIVNQTPVHHRPVLQRPATAARVLASRRSELPNTAKKLAQHAPPLYGHKMQTAQPNSRKANEVPKPKPVPRRPANPTELRKDDETKHVGAKLEKLPNNKLSGTFVIQERADAQMQGDGVNKKARTVNVTKRTSETEKMAENEAPMVDSEDEVKAKAEDERTRDVGNATENVMGGTAASENLLEEAKCLEDAPLLDLKPSKEATFVIISGANDTTETVKAATVFEQKEDEKKEKEVEEESSMVKAQVIAKLEDSADNEKQPETVISAPAVEEKEGRKSEVTAAGEGQRNAEVSSEVSVQDMLPVSDKLPKNEADGKQNVEIIRNPEEIIESGEERSIVPAVAEEGDAVQMERKEASTIQSTSSPKINGFEAFFEDSKFAEEKRMLDERRRVQEERLEKEQREREMRKAKLASIMSRTRGAPLMAVVTPTTQNINSSEVVSQESMKVTECVPSPVESTPVKSALSHTAASVLQKLATTNPKLLSVLQRNGSNPSLADELSAADPSISMTLPGQPDEPIGAHEGSSTVRHLPFEPDVNHRPVAMN